jgi:hypothetical protein
MKTGARVLATSASSTMWMTCTTVTCRRQTAKMPTRYDPLYWLTFLSLFFFFFHAKLGHEDPDETANQCVALQVKQQRLAAWKQLVKKYPAVDEDILYSTFKELGVCAAGYGFSIVGVSFHNQNQNHFNDKCMRCAVGQLAGFSIHAQVFFWYARILEHAMKRCCVSFVWYCAGATLRLP